MKSVTDEALRKALDAALLPMVKSIGPWGVVDAHWRPDPAGQPVIWLRTRTEIERVALQAQPWVLTQVQIMMTRLSVPYSAVSKARLEVTSLEAEDRLLDG